MAVAVVQDGSCSSDLTPSPGLSTCCRCNPKKQKTKPKSNNNNNKKKTYERPILNIFVFLGPHPRHMEVPRLGVKLEL